VLPPGAVRRTVREQHAGRVVDALGRLAANRIPEPLDQVAQRVDREMSAVRQPLVEHVARGHQVRVARRRAQVVLEHLELALLVADDVETGGAGVGVVGDDDVAHPRLVVHAAGEDALGQAAGGDHPALAVGVGDELVERAHALREARRQVLPLVRRQQPRDRVDLERRVAARASERAAARVQIGPDRDVQVLEGRSPEGPR